MAHVNFRLNRLLMGVFSGGLAILPLVYWPAASVPYEIPKVEFVWWWVDVLLVLGLMSLVFGYKLNQIRWSVGLVMVMYLITAFGASWLGIDWAKSWWGNYYRGDGLFTLIHLAGLTLVISIFWQKSWYKWVTRGIVFGSVVASLLALVEGYRFWVLKDQSAAPFGNGAIGATFGQPNFLGGYLAVSLPLTLAVAGRWGVGLQLLAIGLTQSGGAWLVAGLFLGGIGLVKCRLKKVFIVFMAGVLVGGVVWAIKQPGFTSMEGRSRIWHRALISWRERPLTGYGLANFDKAMEVAVWPLPVSSDVYIDKAHSVGLEILVTMGVLGFTSYLVLNFMVVRSLKQNRQASLWIMILILYWVHSQTNVISINEEVLFWLTVGVGMRRA